MWLLAEQQPKKKAGLWHQQEKQNKHGRKEIRSYSSYKLEDLITGKTWKYSAVKSLIVVRRFRQINTCKNKANWTTSYYVSNIALNNLSDAQQVYRAIRQHWQIEVKNNIRDTILKEDQLFTSKPLLSKILAYCRTIAVELLDSLKPNNRRAQLELFADDFKACLRCFKQLRVL